MTGYRVRALPVEEWPRLAHTEAGMVWPHLDPSKSTIIVVEKDGEIIGCHALLYVLHAECLWIDPRFRGRSSVARRLWEAVRRAALACGARTLVTASMDVTVERLLAHVEAVRLPGTHFSIPLRKGTDVCQRR